MRMLPVGPMTMGVSKISMQINSEVLIMLEDVDDWAAFEVLLEIMASEGLTGIPDIITDVQVLGLVQAFDQDAGRVTLSAFGAFSQATMKQPAQGGRNGLIAEEHALCL